MNHGYDEVFRKLKVIGAFRENKYLYTEGGSISVSPPSAWQGLMRIWYNEDRYKNLNNIAKTAREAFAILDTTIDKEQIHNHVGETKEEIVPIDKIDTQRFSNLQLLWRTRRYLQDAEIGIRRFIKSYREDANISAHGTILLDEIGQKLNNVEHSLKQFGLNFQEIDTVMVGIMETKTLETDEF